MPDSQDIEFRTVARRTESPAEINLRPHIADRTIAANGPARTAGTAGCCFPSADLSAERMLHGDITRHNAKDVVLAPDNLDCSVNRNMTAGLVRQSRSHGCHAIDAASHPVLSDSSTPIEQCCHVSCRSHNRND